MEENDHANYIIVDVDANVKGEDGVEGQKWINWAKIE